jgi:hypothetical protein
MFGTTTDRAKASRAAIRRWVKGRENAAWAAIRRRGKAVRVGVVVTVRGQAALLKVTAMAVAGIGLVVLLALLLLKWAPIWLANTGGLKPPEAAAEVSRVRTALLAVIGGSIATAGVIYTARTYSLNRQGQITERFTRAVDQLGNASVNVQLGAIYALERIAGESPVDRDPIIQILIGFMREHSPEPPEDLDHYTNSPAPTNLQSALDVLARRDVGGMKGARLDLSRLNLRGADLTRGKFARAQFTGTDLSTARMSDADFENGWFSEATLRWASLRRANLKDAFVLGADFEKATLDGANLEHTYIGSSTKLVKTSLREANLADANLERAELDETELAGAIYNEKTKWPDDFDPDAAGAVRA